jgi:hypothetical protein
VGEQTKAGDAELWVERHGHGPDILLIAGIGDPAEAWQQSLEAFQAQVDVCLAHDTADRLSQIAAPTLVVAGELDVILPPRFGRFVADAIPNARVDVMPGEAHQPFQEVPDDFNARVDAFWREVEARADSERQHLETSTCTAGSRMTPGIGRGGLSETGLSPPFGSEPRHVGHFDRMAAMWLGRPKRWSAASMVEADRRLGRDAAVPAVRLGTTGSVASAPSTALRAAAVASMSAIGFMEPSVALVFININHEFDASIK